MDPTAQYRLNLPCILHSVSPALSALHASRAAALHPDISTLLQTSHCPKCGKYRFSGDHPTHLVGSSPKKKRRRTTSSGPKPLQRRCHICGFSIDTHPSPNDSSAPAQLPGDPGTAITPPWIRGTGQERPPADILLPVAGTVATTIRTPAPPLPGRQFHPKTGHPKAPTLRDMLSRNRQREEGAKAHQKRKEGHDRLAAFLKEL